MIPNNTIDRLRSANLLPWYAKYIGIPFKDGGRDFHGVDCWRLVCLVFKEEWQITLPDYGEISALELRQVAELIARDAYAEPWIEVVPSCVRAFDVAVMHKRREPVHIGVMVTKNEMIHVEEKTATVMVSITHPSVAFRSINFFRHRKCL